MSKWIPQGRSAPGLIIGLLALFVALGGGAIAASKLSKNSVKSKHIKNGQVKKADLAANAVDSGKVANNSLTGDDINESTLSGVGGGGGGGGGSDFKANVTETIDLGAIGATDCIRSDRTTGALGSATAADEVIVTPPPNKQQSVVITATTFDGGVHLDACAIGAIADPPSGEYEFSLK